MFTCVKNIKLIYIQHIYIVFILNVTTNVTSVLYLVIFIIRK